MASAETGSKCFMCLLCCGMTPLIFSDNVHIAVQHVKLREVIFVFSAINGLSTIGRFQFRKRRFDRVLSVFIRHLQEPTKLGRNVVF